MLLVVIYVFFSSHELSLIHLLRFLLPRPVLIPLYLFFYLFQLLCQFFQYVLFVLLFVLFSVNFLLLPLRSCFYLLRLT